MENCAFTKEGPPTCISVDLATFNTTDIQTLTIIYNGKINLEFENKLENILEEFNYSHTHSFFNLKSNRVIIYTKEINDKP